MNRSHTILAMLLMLLPLSTQAQELHLTASVMPSYYSGTYGTNTRTDIFYVPLDIEARRGDWTLRATIPYIRVHSHGAIVAGGAVVGTSTSGKSTTNSGLGDIWLEGRYRFHLDKRGDSLSPYLKYKFGTASRTKGLGTGANDYEYGGILHLRAGAKLFPFARLGYRIHGQAPGYTLNNTLIYQAGASFFVNPSNIATLMYAGNGASQSTLQPGSMAIAAWNYRHGKHSELQAYGLLGMSTGSPDYGGGLGYFYHF